MVLNDRSVIKFWLDLFAIISSQFLQVYFKISYAHLTTWQPNDSWLNHETFWTENQTYRVPQCESLKIFKLLDNCKCRNEKIAINFKRDLSKIKKVLNFSAQFFEKSHFFFFQISFSFWMHRTSLFIDFLFWCSYCW